MKNQYQIRTAVDALFLLITLPLIGIVFKRVPLRNYIEFPPVTQYVEHAGFSLPVFIGMAALILAILIPFIARILRSSKEVDTRFSRQNPFPWWGWLGIAITGATWVIAWTRFAWLAPLQPFTFSPLWFGYILIVNGVTLRRTGRCMLRDHPWHTAALFILSAGFWWYFEYLNRFVQNWYYVGITDLTKLQYFIYATLPFSTVLPAVLGTKDLLASFPRLSRGLQDFAAWRNPYPVFVAWCTIIVSCGSLAAIGVWPDFLFPLLWLAPLLIITSMQRIQGRRTLFADIETGNWANIVLLALAALVCGFFWEMWNVRSVAKWIYAVPFVGKFKIFEMPVLGYAGYLPFGLECAVVAGFLRTFTDDHRDNKIDSRPPPSRGSTLCTMTNKLILAGLGLFFFITPGLQVANDLRDPGLRNEQIPNLAWRLHRDLSPRYETWARRRMASGVAAELSLYDVPSTEWPMFGSVYYLWATESLQHAWEQDHSLSRKAPREYARGTIEAAVDLILDPVHHSWVKTHWGPDYMHTQNVFFRSMIIAACTSHENLIGGGKHLALLRDQVDSLAAELEASPYGILEDYPDECYPIDVLAAITCIQRADKVLGTDHSAFVARSIRAFEGTMLDKRGLPPYFINASTGRHLGPSRGVGNSYVLLFTPELWQGVSQKWYQQYEDHFWQDVGWAEGFREFPKKLELEFSRYDGTLYDVDAGPIVAGFSPAANAFGLAAAKINGRLDHAYTLGTQIIASTWPLPNGTLLGPRILSSRSHAPYLGEACTLFLLAQQPHSNAQIVTGGRMPSCVWMGLAFYFGTGGIMLLMAAFGALRWTRGKFKLTVENERLQLSIWLALLLGALVAALIHHSGIALLLLFVAQFFPLTEKLSKVLRKV